MSKILLKISDIFTDIALKGEKDKDSVFIPGSEPILCGFVVSFLITTILLFPMAFILDSILIWCDPDGVLYSFFIVGLLTTTLSIGFAVYSLFSIGFKMNLMMLFIGTGFVGVFYLLFSSGIIHAIYGRLYLIPVC